MTLSTGAASLDTAHCAHDLLGGEGSDTLAAEAPAAGDGSVLIVAVWHNDRLVARTRELQCGLRVRYRRQCFYRMSACAAMHSLSITEQDWLGPLRDLLEAAGAAGETQPGWAQRVVWGLGEAIIRQGARRRGYGELDERSASLAERLLIRDQANLEHRLVGNAALFLRHVKNHRPSSGRPSCVSSRQAHL